MTVSFRLGRLIAPLLIALAMIVSACSSSGWTSGQEDEFRQGVCVEWGGVSKNSADCQCLLDATQDAYPEADDFGRSTGPGKLTSGYARCGFLFSD